MQTRLWAGVTSRWYDVQDKLWFIPSVFTLGAAVLAIVMVEVDRSWVPERGPDWLFDAGASGAREVLSAIAGTMITVTGLVFSITIVALQLASSQFTPRVLRSFTGDRGNQLVLGTFIATFTYALLVLRTVRDSSDGGPEAFVPAASVTVALILTATSVGCLIYYISHAADSIRASVVIDRAARDALRLIERLYGGRDGSVNTAKSVHRPPSSAVEVRSTKVGYIQAVSDRLILASLEADDLTLELGAQIGDFLYEGSHVGLVWPGEIVDKEVLARINDGLVVGTERTLHADIELSIRQISDIAVKALSPGVNDPTTATICIDRIGELLLEIVDRPRMDAVKSGRRGRGTMRRTHTDWDQLVDTGFNEIRHYGQDDPQVAEHLSRTLARMAEIVSDSRARALVLQRDAVLEGARREIQNTADVDRIVSAS